jgi:hypothetical protein
MLRADDAGVSKGRDQRMMNYTPITLIEKLEKGV